MSKTVCLRLLPEHIGLAENGLLTHQEETLLALENHSIVMNCAMTGAGKTKASHLGVKAQAVDQSVLFIAPTNALVSQHQEDAKRFVRENGLPHKVVAVDGRVLFQLQRRYPGFHRPSAVLHQLIYNPRAFSRDLEIDDQAGPLWLITNPDQVWLSIVQGRQQDTRNLLIDFINRFQFVVVDEFHYYSAEQLVLFFLCVAFWKHFGQFEHGLKMLLLTATPDPLVKTFFERMALDPVMVGLEREKGNGSLPVLSPVDLTLSTGELRDYTDVAVREYQLENEGVVISDSLFEINKTFKYFESQNIPAGRITGPIHNQQRRQESQKPLILATPTVDLGYNFIKAQPKSRQTIDYLISKVRTQSAFWQRLGRAGRVLGRTETGIPSRAVMLLPDSGAYQRARDLDGQAIRRSELKQRLDLRDKRLKGHALTREGLFTATHQLIEIEKMLPQAHKTIVERIFETLKSCLDPDNASPNWPSFRKRHWLCKQFRELGREYQPLSPFHVLEWIKREPKQAQRYTPPLETLIGAWAKNHFFQKGQLDAYQQYIRENDRRALILPLVRKQRTVPKAIVTYYQEQMLRLNYLFNFRGSAKGETVWVHDPDNLYSAHRINTIDLVTLLARYRFSSPLPRAQAEKAWHLNLPPGDIFFEITDFQEYPYRPVFEYPDRLPEVPAPGKS